LNKKAQQSPCPIWPNEDIRKYSFPVRVIGVWNSLPEHVINAQSLNSFKNRLDKWWQLQDLVYNYDAALQIQRYKGLVDEETTGSEEELEVEQPIEAEKPAGWNSLGSR